MSLLVKNIIELNLLEGAKIAAGERGVNNEISWVNLMEILDALDSLQKGELLTNFTFSHITHVLMENISLQLNLHDDSDFMNLRNKLCRIVNDNSDNYIYRMLESRLERVQHNKHLKQTFYTQAYSEKQAQQDK